MPPFIGIMCQASMCSLQLMLSIDMLMCFSAALLAMANSQECINLAP